MLGHTVRKILTGNSFSQEYLCIPKKSPNLLAVSIRDNSGSTDITDTHLLLGYQPLIIGIYCQRGAKTEAVLGETVKIDFHQGFENVGHISLARRSKIELENYFVVLYEGVDGSHRLLNSFHQWTNRCIEAYRRKSPGNANLSGNRYEQVRLAYSVPRTIAIASVAHRELVNLFPTDLHGGIGDSFYVDSLRLGGVANEQVESSRRAVISEVQLPFAAEVYTMGKNHMREWQRRDRFNLLTARSEKFDFPLYVGTIRYVELSLIKSVDMGIHRVHFFSVINRATVKEDTGTLSHIHKYYAAWRERQGMKTDYWLR